MARTKKLTDPIYSPTNPTSEAAIRAQIDDSIQEVYDQSAKATDTVNLTGDQTIADVKTFSSSPIVPTPTTSTQVANKAYVDGVAISATIPLDSLTDDYLASAPGNIKPRVVILETDFGTAQTDITNLETDVEIINTAVDDTGTVNNIVIATAGTFDLTKNKNVTPFIIPLFTNTNATVNIAIDGQANKLIKKANDTGTLVALEVGDIKKNVPIQLVWDSVNDFFIFAPKGGGSVAVQYGSVSMSATQVDVTLGTSVDLSKSYPVINIDSNGSNGYSNWVEAELINSTTLRLKVGNTGAVVNWYVVTRSDIIVQKVSVTFTSTQQTINTAINSVNLNKTFLLLTRRYPTNSGYFLGHSAKLTSNIQLASKINFNVSDTVTSYMTTYIIEQK